MIGSSATCSRILVSQNFNCVDWSFVLDDLVSFPCTYNCSIQLKTRHSGCPSILNWACVELGSLPFLFGKSLKLLRYSLTNVPNLILASGVKAFVRVLPSFIRAGAVSSLKLLVPCN